MVIPALPGSYSIRVISQHDSGLRRREVETQEEGKQNEHVLLWRCPGLSHNWRQSWNHVLSTKFVMVISETQKEYAYGMLESLNMYSWAHFFPREKGSHMVLSLTQRCSMIPMRYFIIARKITKQFCDAIKSLLYFLSLVSLLVSSYN